VESHGKSSETAPAADSARDWRKDWSIECQANGRRCMARSRTIRQPGTKIDTCIRNNVYEYFVYIHHILVS
jgi:hypothetical protein